jgi:hypothetical protein
MNSPAKALLWEIWRKNRWGFALLVVLFAVCLGLSRYAAYMKETVSLGANLPLAVAGAEYWLDAGLGWSSVLFGFSVLVMFAIFGCSEAHARIGFTGIPPRQFALPVRTRTLVLWPSLLGSVTVAVFSLAWSRFVLGPLLPEGMVVPDVYLAVLLPAGLAVFQALVWGLPSFPKTRAFLVVLLVLGLIPLAAIAFGMQLAAGSGWPAFWATWQPRLIVLFVLAWAAGIAVAWFGVRLERRGAWASWQRSARLGHLLRAWTPRSLDFGSPLHAQFWMEWRRNCRLALLVWTIVIWSILGLSWLLGGFNQHLYLSGVDDGLVFLTTIGVIGCTAIMGLNLARDGASRKLACSSFVATRPIRSGELLTAKLLAGFAAWILAMLIFALSTLVVTVLAGPQLHVSGLPVTMLLLAVSLNVFVGILPLSLSGRIPGLPWSLLPLVLIYGVLGQGLSWFNHHGLQGLLFLLLLVAVVVKLWVAVWGFRRAIGLRLVGFGFVGAYVAFWLLGTGLLVLMAVWLLAQRWSLREAALLVPAAILVLPLARVALSPLALAMNRHR